MKFIDRKKHIEDQEEKEKSCEEELRDEILTRVYRLYQESGFDYRRDTWWHRHPLYPNELISLQIDEIKELEYQLNIMTYKEKRR